MPQFPANIDLSSLDGTNGFALDGGPFSHLGGSVASAGDVNGDGFADMIVGSHYAGAYVVFGSAHAPGARLALTSLNGANGFSLSGGGQNFGASVASAGDVNGDGFDDLIVGSTDDRYVVFGKAGGFAANLDVSSLNGANGFRMINGGASAFGANHLPPGGAVASAGDINGDGFDDLIVGAGGGYDGASYVVFGKATGFSTTLNLAALNGSDGFKLSAEATSDNSGWSVASAGDLNGDGFDDLIVGAPHAGLGGYLSGASYVVYGKATTFAANLTLSSLDGSNGFKVVGESTFDRSGSSVASAGDVNGDGYGDLIIGATFADPNSTGAGYVVFGKAGGFGASINLGSLDGTNGFRLTGVTAYSRAGWSVASAGDVNGDGFDDLMVGAYRANPNGSHSGAGYLVFGKAGGFAPNLDLSGLNGTNGFRLSGVGIGDYAGASVASAGDVNGDGVDDILVGAPTNVANGAAYVVYGRPTGVLQLSNLSEQNGSTLVGSGTDGSGYQVASAGDVNGDGFDDVIVSAFTATANGVPSGASYVVFGGPGALPAILSLSTLNGTNGFKLNGVAAGDFSGWSVASAGDVNGDGYDDMIVGAPHALGFAGDSYVVFGKPGGFAANLDLANLNGANGFRLTGVAAGDRSGTSVASAGDVNGDGYDDMIVGAPHALGFAGVSYVVFGKAGGFAPNLDLSSLDGTSGFKLSGTAAAELTGFSVASAGDVNGDGFADLIVGGYGSAGGNGAAYVILGKASGFSANLDLSSLTGVNGFKLSDSAHEEAGWSVASAGDITGDGFDDVIVGARFASPHGGYSGASYVVFGKAGGFAANLDLAGLNGTNGFKLSGVSALDDTGVSVASAGDFNGDGFADLIVGAYAADTNGANSGASYLIYGKASGFAANLDLFSLDGTSGFRLDGASGGDLSGHSVASAGDLNGDGLDDLIIGGNASRPIEVVYGRAQGSVIARTGGSASQSLVGTDRNDVLSGLGGGDHLFGHAGNDDLSGGTGNDLLSGGSGDDQLDGGSGNDTLDGGPGNDLLAGLGGIDTASYASATSGVSVSLATSGQQDTLGAGLDTLTGVENLTGSAFADHLTGDSGANTLAGGGGNDTLDGGGGNDTASYASDASGVMISLALAGSAQATGGSGSDTLISIENLTGSAFDDALTGDSNGNLITAGLGDDLLDGGAGSDTLDGGNGSDTAAYASALSGVSVDLSLTAAQNTGGAGNDTLISIQNLTGSAFSDTLSGDGGDNVLSGAGGNDSIDGGAGDDTAVFSGQRSAYSITFAGHQTLVTDLTSGFAEGIDTLTHIEQLRFADQTDIVPPSARNDLTGDGKADILWRNANNGDVYLFASSPSAVAAPGQDLGLMAANLHVDQVADFNGDGRADILWRDTSNGDAFLWTSTANAIAAPGPDLGLVPLSSQVQAAADFNGDGKADILWRDTSTGDTVLWNSSANAVAAPSQDLGVVGLQWHVQAAADFNGDGKADILWRNMGNGDVYLWTSSPNAVAAPGQDLGLVAAKWQVQAAADFNGDGKADILWRNMGNGDVYLWTSSANGVAAPGVDLGIVSGVWQVQQAADFNGDGLADILWRNTANGDAYLWTSSGGAIAAPGIDLGIVATNWQVIAPTIF